MDPVVIPLHRQVKVILPVRKVPSLQNQLPGHPKKKYRLSPEPGHYTLPLMPKASMVITPDCNWGLKRMNALLNSLYRLPDPLFNLWKNRLKLEIGVWPEVFGQTEHFDRRTDTIRLTRGMGFEDNLPLLADHRLESTFNTGQIQIKNGDTPECRQKLKALHREMVLRSREDDIEGVNRAFAEADFHFLRAPVQGLTQGLGHQCRFWLRNTFPSEELGVVSDAYLKGRKRFLQTLPKFYQAVSRKELAALEAAMTQYDQKSQEPPPDDIMPALFEGYSTLRHVVERLGWRCDMVDNVHNATQVEAIAGLTGLLLRIKMASEDRTAYRPRGSNSWFVLRHFKELNRYLIGKLSNPEALAEINRTIGETPDPPPAKDIS